MNKNRFRNKLGGIMLSVLLLMAMPTVTEQAYGIQAEPFEAYADALNQLGVLAGTENGYELERTPTRLESIILFIKLLGEEDKVEKIIPVEKAFDDVPDWGSHFAEYAYIMGYTSGVGNREFGANFAVNPNSYMTFILRALGYQSANEKDSGDFTWATATEDAARLGVISTQDADMLNAETFTRGHVAYVSYKALESKVKGTDQTLFEALSQNGRIEGEFPVVDEQAYSADQTSAVESEKNRRMAEIRKAYLEIYKPDESTSYFQVTPNYNSPYLPGEVSEPFQRAAVDTINFIRLLAGVDTNVTANDTWSMLAQHGAFVNYLNGALSHYPTQPVGMSEDMFSKAEMGASSSNIYYGYNHASQMELNNSIVSYMDDSDPYNIEKLGHRRWLIHPNLTQVGIGYVSDGRISYSAIRVFDQNDFKFDVSQSPDFVAWPSQGVFPTAFFADHIAWSVSLNPTIFDNSKIGDIKVTLVNNTTGSQSVFTQAELKLKSESTQKYFNIDTYGYGVPFCIVFRADAFRVTAGDVYTVKIEGLYKKDGSAYTLTYQTEFFDL